VEPLHIVGVREPEALGSDVEFDTYIPFRFRTTRRPVGASFLRLGDLKRTLLELAVDPATQLLTGVTLTSVARVDEGLAPTVNSVRRGLPVLGTSFAAGAQVVNLGRDFRVVVGPAGLLVHWGERSAPTTALDWGRVRFLVSGGDLTGVWCGSLSKEEREKFDAASRC
jgi:hypothetical protein